MTIRTARFRPLIRSRAPWPRWRSSIHAPRSGRFSIVTSGSTSKQAVLDYIGANGCRPASAVTRRHAVWTEDSDAAVILASVDHAPWLEDERFISEFLRLCAFNLPKDGSEPREVSVLAAAVDGLAPRQQYGKPLSGLSVLHGRLDALLPGLWGDSELPLQRAVDRQSAISVTLNPLLGDYRPLNITVPLANTIFQTGRRTTLLASRWVSHGEDQPFRLSSVVEKHVQAVVPSLKSIQAHTSVSIPLVPITRPRRIVASLGNIVRQTEVDDVPSPASRELEAVIPQILEARATTNSAVVPGPLGVWALVAPRETAAAGLLDELLAPEEYGGAAEHSSAETVSRNFSRLLGAGCHLHRILSGGGGWGLKQGLLSLDPQTRHASDADQDIDSFISAFKGEEAPGGVVSPGAYIQFYVEPVPLDAEQDGIPEPAASLGPPPSIVFGTSHTGLEPRSDAGGDSVGIIHDHFGSLSKEGIYVDSVPEPSHAIDEKISIHTKVDSPCSYVWEGAKRWV